MGFNLHHPTEGVCGIGTGAGAAASFFFHFPKMSSSSDSELSQPRAGRLDLTRMAVGRPALGPGRPALDLGRPAPGLSRRQGLSRVEFSASLG